MAIVNFLQSLSSSFLTTLATIFEFMGSHYFFIFLFAIFFLIVDKKFAFKYFLTYSSGFIIGSLFIKNVFYRRRPYLENEGLLSMRNSYSGSLPSSKAMVISEGSAFVYSAFSKKRDKTFKKVILIICLSIICLCVGFSQIYFANNYLSDVFLGFALGLLLSILILKLIKTNVNKIILNCIFQPLLLVLLFIFVKEWGTNNFSNALVFEFIGISSSILLGCFIEEKFINCEIKNNLFFTSFKILIILITLIAYHFFCFFVLPGLVIFSFIKFFVLGLIITMLFPLIFKKLEKYFYIFSPNVKKEDVVFSKISTSVNSTKKISKNVLSLLNKGDVVLLSGDLGAGKSELVRAVLNASGVTSKVTSPTFTLVNDYVVDDYHFYHFDMYRISSEEEVINIDFQEIIDNSDAIKFIEWPEKVAKFLPTNYKKITIVKLGKKLRNIIFEDKTN